MERAPAAGTAGIGCIPHAPRARGGQNHLPPVPSAPPRNDASSVVRLAGPAVPANTRRPPVDDLRTLTGGLGVHSVLECVGISEAQLAAVSIARPGGAVGCHDNQQIGRPNSDASTGAVSVGPGHQHANARRRRRTKGSFALSPACVRRNRFTACAAAGYSTPRTPGDPRRAGSGRDLGRGGRGFDEPS